MSSGQETTKDEAGTEEPRIPRPPTPAELDEMSKAQGMITDEWAPTAPEAERGPKGTGTA